MTIDLTGRVAIVTGAGGGLGRSHALLLAKRGAKVVVNDLGGSVSGGNGSGAAADDVVEEIIAAGGEAISSTASVAEMPQVEAMVATAMERWGRIDILVNNAGILRDKTFAKMDMADFRIVMDVHVMGAAYCTKAVWDIMRSQTYGRIVMTTSSSGLFGNFGQANYGAAKMAVVGLMQTLALEGERYGIRVNCLAPTAATRMLEGLLAPEALERLRPDAVSPGVLALVSDDAPTRTILCAGAGSFEQAHITLTRGIHGGAGDNVAETIAANWAAIGDQEGAIVPANAGAQGAIELEKAAAARG